MIELIDYSDDMFDFILESNNINKPQVGYLHKERLELLLKQANYCKIAKLNGEAAGFLLCLPENKEYDSTNYEWVSKRFSNFLDNTGSSEYGSKSVKSNNSLILK